jgi:hypothetical protein
MEQIEPGLARLVSELLYEKGYHLVIPSAQGRGIDGRGEFGISIKVAGTEKTRRVDVVAARWDDEQDIRAIAVECKGTVWAVYDGLGQAVQYQSLFDEVYVATPATVGVDSISRPTLVDLGLGHIEVDEDAAEAYVSVVPHAQRPSRFEPHLKAREITPRLALGLTFLEIKPAGRPLRYGFSKDGLSVWYAEEVAGHLQWNCGFDYPSDERGAHEMYMGINVERTEDVKRICGAISAERLQNAFTALSSEYSIEVWYRPTPPTAKEGHKKQISETARTAVADLVIRQLKQCPAKYRPSLWLGLWFERQAWQAFTRPEYRDRLGQIRRDLGPIMAVLEECYG